VILGLRFVAKRGDVDLAGAAVVALSKIEAGIGPEISGAMRANRLAASPSSTVYRKRIGAVRKAMGQKQKARSPISAERV
jgi:hypothetical protein